VANPLNAVRQYIENLEEFKSVLTESGGIIDNTNSQGFRDRQKKEIDNFITAVRFFTKKEGYADKKIGFKPL
jgi:ribosomal protein S6